MKKGLYLYCVRKKNPAAVKAVKTIDKGEVYTVSYKELEAVVSPVDLKEFSSEEIQKKAQGDVNWIKGKAQIHEHVIEQAMGVVPIPTSSEVGKGKIIPVIPMKFGIIFKTKQSLEKMLKKNYAKFKASLENLVGKQEWGMKVYLNEDVFEKTIHDRQPKPIQDRKKLPRGMDFFAKKKMEEAIAKEKDRKLKRVIQEIFGNLQKLAVEASQGKNLDKAITGRKELMVLNANLLLKEEKVGKFQKEVNGLKTRYQNQGLIIQESGPWPPYNFVEI